MPYPEFMVSPMREDPVRVGFTELRTPADVDEILGEKKPEVLTTVFAGQDIEATERASQYIAGYPPSSPSVALFKGGELVRFMERHRIEGRHPEDIAQDLREAYARFC
ncbi:MAG: BrxA/BrxB family bacilliredoxin [Gemmatimonadetes bacterium]|nr:BrxA/BrxB family bacilliredoxin [Gemmatimonadota bacterium]